jgi:hypothetical protein
MAGKPRYSDAEVHMNRAQKLLKESEGDPTIVDLSLVRRCLAKALRVSARFCSKDRAKVRRRVQRIRGQADQYAIAAHIAHARKELVRLRACVNEVDPEIRRRETDRTHWNVCHHLGSAGVKPERIGTTSAELDVLKEKGCA